MPRTTFLTNQFALVICRDPKCGKFLIVNETRDRGWWIPGGAVDSGQSFKEAAVRECMEETGIQIELKGIIAMTHHLHRADGAKFTMIFYAEPKYPYSIPKQEPDEESLCAEWATIEEFKQKNKIRGKELITYGRYIEKNGYIFPLGMFQETKHVIKETMMDENEKHPDKKRKHTIC